MRLLNIRELTKEQLAEESMIDIVYAILTERHESLTFQQLMDEIRELTGISESEMKAKLQQFYTDLNIDGRFIAIHDNRWGLREWYPVEQIEEETAPVVKVRKKKKKKVLDDEEEEELYDEDEEEYDELIEEDDEIEDDDDLEDEEDEEIIELEEDLLEPDDDLEIIPDDEDLDLEDEEEEDEFEEDEEIEE
ncbi:DNA-directed RNA polymerase subunit delta [Sporosarcina sp. 179-K 3D1 HS]|uniref:DNA-directed RNA polymerase subunit delta n=1 Tax=Sporosarcina sp. 179-K 3D1 HS TaxID=3232169 RepID=UPI0039A23363